MSFTHTVGITWSGGTTTVTGSFTNTADGEDNRDVSVAAATNNVLTNMNIDISQLKSLLVLSDKDVTIKTNSTSSPQETLTIKANVPYIYVSNTGANNAVPFAGDVTAFYLSNAGASDATVKIRMLQDATP
jgi:hypothetical protein